MYRSINVQQNKNLTVTRQHLNHTPVDFSRNKLRDRAEIKAVLFTMFWFTIFFIRDILVI